MRLGRFYLLRTVARRAEDLSPGETLTLPRHTYWGNATVRLPSGATLDFNGSHIRGRVTVTGRGEMLSRATVSNLSIKPAPWEIRLRWAHRPRIVLGSIPYPSDSDITGDYGDPIR